MRDKYIFEWVFFLYYTIVFYNYILISLFIGLPVPAEEYYYHKRYIIDLGRLF